jgi:hypothetical protein
MSIPMIMRLIVLSFVRNNTNPVPLLVVRPCWLWNSGSESKCPRRNPEAMRYHAGTVPVVGTDQMEAHFEAMFTPKPSVSQCHGSGGGDGLIPSANLIMRSKVQVVCRDSRVLGRGCVRDGQIVGGEQHASGDARAELLNLAPDVAKEGVAGPMTNEHDGVDGYAGQVHGHGGG